MLLQRHPKRVVNAAVHIWRDRGVRLIGAVGIPLGSSSSQNGWENADLERIDLGKRLNGNRQDRHQAITLLALAVDDSGDLVTDNGRWRRRSRQNTQANEDRPSGTELCCDRQYDAGKYTYHTDRRQQEVTSSNTFEHEPDSLLRRTGLQGDRPAHHSRQA
jgi:hypothetical protein